MLNLISHATQERLKNLVSKLSVVAEHRLDVIKTEGETHISMIHPVTFLSLPGPYVGLAQGRFVPPRPVLLIA